MPRTAVTLGKLRTDGSWKLLSGPDVPQLEQSKAFKEGRGMASHDTYSEVWYQESDQPGYKIAFKTKEQVAQAAAEKQKGIEAQKKAQEALAARAEKEAAERAKVKSADQAAYLARHSAQLAQNRTDFVPSPAQQDKAQAPVAPETPAAPITATTSPPPRPTAPPVA